ncbi:methyl-accepting chemotaxis protein [Aquabacterium sp. A7-Y]|uniref:methyl-accepting chemotaxis protein n=1 Tax=Aquabacterium sp. A7-Y TaxID=1349605 RepID=UPI00223E3117|nr:methyl-accepting chemotaxis protein [Aquabacterium sp. A7-Y]MCW7536859.1 methyl-accepting chemotaxis protein [Aquabacterium sp. A7-Y]
MWLRNMRIGTRLYLGFGLAILMLAAALLIAGVVGHRDRSRLVHGLDRSAEKAGLALAMRTSILASAVGMRNLVLQGEVGPIQQEEQKVREHLKAFQQARARLVEIGGLSATEQQTLDALLKLENELQHPFTQAVALSLAFDSEAAIGVMNKQVDPLQQKLLARLGEFADLQTQQTKELFEAAEASGQDVNRLMTVVGVIAGLAAAAAAVVITRSIKGPLAEAVVVLHRISRGDLSRMAEDRGRDEVAQVLAALGAMTRDLTAMVQRVRESSDTIALASREIASGNSDLSARTESQAAGLQQTAASLQQLTDRVRINAEHARNANSLAVAAAGEAEAGGKLMGEVVGTMDSIQSASTRVNDIIGVIDGIAFQTNILALNAAVEAARAGEHGRGFAVVAAEVRVLAQRSASAAKEIKGLIAESGDRVRDGAQLVSRAGRTMEEIVRGIKAVTEAVGSITHSSHEQAEGIEQVNVAVEQMDHGTQQNAALVEQSAASAMSLQGQAARLVEAVAVFKTA